MKIDRKIIAELQSKKNPQTRLIIYEDGRTLFKNVTDYYKTKSHIKIVLTDKKTDTKYTYFIQLKKQEHFLKCIIKDLLETGDWDFFLNSTKYHTNDRVILIKKWINELHYLIEEAQGG